jgi:hypothetical protein
MKTLLFIIALASLTCLVLIGLREDDPVVASGPETDRGPSFEVHVVRPRSARPLFGILPAEIEAKLVEDRDLGFDDASHGAAIGSVGRDHLALSADGWELWVEADGDGRVVSATHLVFPVILANTQRTLRCRPAARPSGYLRTSPWVGFDELDGRFLVELATCENVETGRAIEWPPAPLTVRGTFEGLSQGDRSSQREVGRRP